MLSRHKANAVGGYRHLVNLVGYRTVGDDAVNLYVKPLLRAVFVGYQTVVALGTPIQVIGVGNIVGREADFAGFESLVDKKLMLRAQNPQASVALARIVKRV